MDRYTRLCLIGVFLVCLFACLSKPAQAERIPAATLTRVLAIAKAEGVPKSVALALMREESGGDPHAESIRVRGYRSVGLYQLYEAPWNLNELVAKFWRPYEEWTLFDIRDPIHNAKVGLRYLAALHREYGSWYRALLFYNSGTVRNAPEDTRAYALRIVRAP